VAKIKSFNELESLRESIIKSRDPNKTCITLCSGTGCRAYGSEGVATAFKQEIKRQGLAAEIDVRTTGCHGFCEKGTLVVIKPENTFYQRVNVKDIPEIISETITSGLPQKLLKHKA